MSGDLTDEELDQVEIHVRANVERIARLGFLIREAKLAGRIGVAASASQLLSRLEGAQTLAIQHLSRAGRC